jgi:hypothetical protein
MKKLMFALLAVSVLTASSCSKEKKINRRIDGDWKEVSYAGVAVAAEDQATISFAKDKKGGTGSVSYSGSGVTFSIPFTYSLVEDKMTIISTFAGSSETSVVTINTYEKDKLEWTDSDGKKSVMEPK